MSCNGWRLVSDDPVLGVRRWELDLDDTQTIVRTEYYAAEPFMTANAEERNASDGTRWGDGKRVASIPMHIWAREIAPRGDDRDFLKWFLNHPDRQAFRVRRGRV